MLAQSREPRMRPHPEETERMRTPASAPTYDGVPPEHVSIENVKRQVPKTPRDFAVEVFSIEGAEKEAEQALLGSGCSGPATPRVGRLHTGHQPWAHTLPHFCMYHKHATLRFICEVGNGGLLAGVECVGS